MPGAIEAALRRQRRVTIAALALLTLLAWVWLAMGAGMGMAPRADLAMFGISKAGGGMAMDSGNMAMAPAPGWNAAQFLLAFSMWWVMMLAMMLPAAAPVILLHARAIAAREPLATPPTAAFLAGYLAIWGLFSAFAAGLQGTLQNSGMIEPMEMDSKARWLTAALLIAAGFYQMSPFKDVCLAHCRNPAGFLSSHYRPGRAGAFRLGAIHGAYCLGCCWLLMALLFVGGVMNLVWIALLTILVAAEKLLPGGRRIAFAAGFAFIAWGLLTAVG